MTFSLATYNVLNLFDDGYPRGTDGRVSQTPDDASLTRGKTFYPAKLDAIARTLERLDADVVAFQEVGGLAVLDALRERLPARDGKPSFGYLPAVHGTPDTRGIACGILSRFPVRGRKEHAATDLKFPVFVHGDPDPFPGRLGSRRPLLEVTLELPDGSPLVVFAVHLKSRLPTPFTGADGKSVKAKSHREIAEGRLRSQIARATEALFLRSLVDAHFDANLDVQLAILGDFNDSPESPIVQSIVGDRVVGLWSERDAALDAGGDASLVRRVLHACALAVPKSERFTTIWQAEFEQIDHMMVSDRLWRRFVSARILNEHLLQTRAALGDQDLNALESDHAPLMGTFR